MNNQLLSWMFRGIVFTLLLLVLFTLFSVEDVAASDHPILYLFWGDGCSHCKAEEVFLEQLHERHPELEMRWFEVWKHKKFLAVVYELLEAYDIKASSVPLTFLGDMVIVGFLSEETTGVQIEKQVIMCLQEGCIDAFDKVNTLPLVKQIHTEATEKEPKDWQLFPSSLETEQEAQ